MAFTTLKFLIFFAVLMVFYYLIPKKYRWIILLAGSYVFYGFASPWFLIFLVSSSIITFFGAILINKYGEKQKLQKTFLILTIVLQLSTLAVFKYLDFFCYSFVSLLNEFGVELSWTMLNLILPIGLSFYIFQSLGYVIDVYWGKAEPNKNIFKYCLFVSYFPLLLQGPISDYSELYPQLIEGHDFNLDNVSSGIKRCMWGFFKKLVIANHITAMTSSIWANYSSYSGLIWVLIIILYLIEIYADFSGYMDIAIGCSKMLGIDVMENFNRPYFSKTIPEYWRRWHISLGAWFRTYVFYPILKGRFCSWIRRKLRTNHKVLANTIPDAIALLIVWVLLGFWHGPSWGYVLYGVYYGLIITISTLISPLVRKFHGKHPRLKTNKLFITFQIGRTLLLVAIGSFIFRPANIDATLTIFSNMLSGINVTQFGKFGFDYMLSLLIVLFGTILLFIVDLYAYRHEGNTIVTKINSLAIGWRLVIYIGLFAVILIFGAYWSAATNQFMYFIF